VDPGVDDEPARAPHLVGEPAEPLVPRWLEELRRPVRFAPGCYWIDPHGPGRYWIDPHGQSFLWIAANELPLLDELVPFLLARSGQAHSMTSADGWHHAGRPSGF